MTKKDLKEYIEDFEDFPKKGIIFKDISPLLYNPTKYKLAIELIAKKLDDVDVIVSPDARGFLFGPQVAIIKNIPFVMVRKQGKLPGKKINISYELEYNVNSSLEIRDGIIKRGDKVAIIDDVLASGGTSNAIIELIEKQGGIVENAIFLIELEFLNGKKIVNIPKEKIKSIIQI